MGQETAGVETQIGDEYLVVENATDASDFPTSAYRNAGYEGLILFLHVNSVGGTSPSIEAKIQGIVPDGSTTYDILTTGSVTASGITVLRVHPALTDASNEAASDLLPPRWRIDVTLDTADGNETYDYDVYFAYR